jgi:cell division protein FtsW
MSSTKRARVDMPFLLVVSGLVTFGLLIFTSAALGLLARDGGATFSSVASSQLLLGLIGGTLAMALISHIDYRLWRPYTPYFFAFAVGLTLLTFVPGVGLTIRGASRWIEFAGVSFQPEEVLKFATVAFLAALYAARIRAMEQWYKAFLPAAIVGGGAMLILLLQPSTDGAVMIGMATVGILFAAGCRMRHLIILGLVGSLLVGGAVYLQPNLRERVATFLDHTQDPLGAGWQIQQSLIAVGSGELFGRGFGQSLEKFSYLPEPIGDSIFAVAAEEFGFVGSTILVLLFVGFAVLGLRVAARAQDPFGGLLVVGLVILIVGQSFFNMASTLGLVPVSGLPLIFVSHGGTALAIALAEVGVILSVSRRMRS